MYRISAPSRLHISLIDMQGTTSGRVDGGIGIALDNPRCLLQIAPSETPSLNISINDPSCSEKYRQEISNDVIDVIQRLQRSRGLTSGCTISFDNVLGGHAGLGSKTSHLLAAAKLYTVLHNLHLSAQELALEVRRGGTSGIGVQAFDRGGFIVDCGRSFESKGNTFRASSRSKEMAPPPIVFQKHFPDWPILLATPVAKEIHGALEQSLFEEVCPIPVRDVQSVCHATLMMLIPGVLESDLSAFCRGLNIITECRWKAFEISSQAEVVSAILKEWRSAGVTGCGMSSWGSSVFALDHRLEDEGRRRELVALTRNVMNQHHGGVCLVTKAASQGHILTKRHHDY